MYINSLQPLIFHSEYRFYSECDNAGLIRMAYFNGESIEIVAHKVRKMRS